MLAARPWLIRDFHSALALDSPGKVRAASLAPHGAKRASNEGVREAEVFFQVGSSVFLFSIPEIQWNTSRCFSHWKLLIISTM